MASTDLVNGIKTCMLLCSFRLVIYDLQVDYYEIFDDPQGYKDTNVGQAMAPIISKVFGTVFNSVQVRTVTKRSNNMKQSLEFEDYD